MARPDKSYLEKQTSRRNAPKKKKLGEGVTDSRFAKISFKNYLRQIEEELLEDDLDQEDAAEDEELLEDDLDQEDAAEDEATVVFRNGKWWIEDKYGDLNGHYPDEESAEADLHKFK